MSNAQLKQRERVGGRAQRLPQEESSRNVYRKELVRAQFPLKSKEEWEEVGGVGLQAVSLSRQRWKRRAFPDCRLFLARLSYSHLLSSRTPGLLRLALGYTKKLRKRSHRGQKSQKLQELPKNHRSQKGTEARNAKSHRSHGSPLKATEAKKSRKPEKPKSHRSHQTAREAKQ